MSNPQTISIECSINAEPAEVYRGFTHPTLLRDWLCHISSAAAYPGGHIFLRWRLGRTVTGVFTQDDPPHRLAFTWLDTDLPVPSEVRVEIAPKDAASILTLHHTLQDGGASTEVVEKLRSFWNESLENLQSVVETGIDLRQARRPRLGIWMDEFSPEVAAKLGVPVNQGVLVNNTMEGSGARAAGLDKGDVLVSFNSVPLLNPDSFDLALTGLKAGDSAPVEFYRGAERLSAQITLGMFPTPEFPSTAQGLAEKVRELDDSIIDAMRKKLQDLGDEQASARPSENEWSVKEIVAHFILAERDFQGWVADMLNDVPVEDWLQMRSNAQPRITALIARMQSLPALLDEVSLAKAETISMIGALPDKFVSDRKHLYRRIAQWATEVHPAHYFEEHLPQFETAIAAAS